MPKVTNPLKWQGAEALMALGLCKFKMPGKRGGVPVFYRALSEITPVFVFTPYLKWGAVNTSGYLGLSFTGLDNLAASLGKSGVWPPIVIHAANFPGNLTRYISPDDAEQGAFNDWAVLIDNCLRSYPTSAQELKLQLREGRLGGFRAAQQLNIHPPAESLMAWFADRGIAFPPDAPRPIEAVAVLSAAFQ